MKLLKMVKFSQIIDIQPIKKQQLSYRSSYK